MIDASSLEAGGQYAWNANNLANNLTQDVVRSDCEEKLVMLGYFIRIRERETRVPG